MSENYWANDSINISQALYDKLDEIAQKRFGYTGQGIVSDLVEEIVQDYVDKSKLRFRVWCRDLNRRGFNYEVSAIREEDSLDDFVGEFEDLLDKEALLRVAKDGYGIEANEIEFVN